MTQKNSQNFLIQNPKSNQLEWEYFVKKMAELQSQKRDDIPKETIIVWYKTFINKGWDKEKFDRQFDKVLTNPSYGAVKIDEFFNDEVLFTQERFILELNARINGMIQKAQRILRGKEIEIDLPAGIVELDDIKYEISRKVVTYYGTEKKNMIDEIVAEIYPVVLERLGYKTPQNAERTGSGTRLKHKLGW